MGRTGYPTFTPSDIDHIKWQSYAGAGTRFPDIDRSLFKNTRPDSMLMAQKSDEYNRGVWERLEKYNMPPSRFSFEWVYPTEW